MSGYLRSLLSPDRGRWRPMLLGLAAFAALAFAAVAVQHLQPAIAAALTALAVAAWIVGACAMVGYVRWFIAGEVERARRENERR